MNVDRRNPYLILGIEYGTSRERSTEEFARRSRALRRDPNFPYTVDDLTWALHQVEDRISDPSLDLTVFRVPADPRSLEAPSGRGVLRFDPKPLARRTGPVTDEMIRAVRRRALNESIALAIEQEAAQIAFRLGLDEPVTPIQAHVTTPTRQATPSRTITPSAPATPTRPRLAVQAGPASATPQRRPTGRTAIAVAIVTTGAALAGLLAVRLADNERSSDSFRPSDNAAAASDTVADQTPSPTITVPSVATQDPPEPPTTIRPTTTAPTTSIAPSAQHPYFDALTQWTLAGALQMQDLAALGSPAWAYGRHLEQSFRAGGGSLSTSFTPTSADSGDFCIGSSCFVISEITLRASEMYDFAVNGVSLDAMSSAWTADNAPSACWYDGTDPSCPGPYAVEMRLTTVYTVGTTTWVSVEIDTGAFVAPNSEPRLARIQTSSGFADSASFSGSNPIAQGTTTVWLFKFSGVTNAEVAEITVILGWDGTDYDWTFSSL